MNELSIKEFITGLTEEKANIVLKTFTPVVEELTVLGSKLSQIEALEDGLDKSAQAKRFRLDFGKQLTKADKLRKVLKEDSLREGRAIQSVYNYIIEATAKTKKTALDIELYYTRIEEERKESLRRAREAELIKYEIDGSSVELGNMSEEVWLSYIIGVKDTYEKRKVREKEDALKAAKQIEVDNLHYARKDSILSLWRYLPIELQNTHLGMLGVKEWKDILRDLKIKEEEDKKVQEEIRKENIRLEEENRVAAEKIKLLKLKAEIDMDNKVGEEINLTPTLTSNTKPLSNSDKDKLYNLVEYIRDIWSKLKRQDAKNVLSEVMYNISHYTSRL